MDILRNAYNRDKIDDFPQTSEHTKFSNSVVDVFTQLNEALKVLKQVCTACDALNWPTQCEFVLTKPALCLSVIT